MQRHSDSVREINVMATALGEIDVREINVMATALEEIDVIRIHLVAVVSRCSITPADYRR